MPAILEKRYLGAKAIESGEATKDAPYGWVSGVANAFEVDRYGDLVLPEAMGAATAKYMLNPVLSFGHGIDGNPTNGTMPAGSVLSITQDATGNTIFKARWANTEDAQMTRQLYKDRDMRAFSIHFLPYGDSLESRQPTAEEVAKFPGVKRVITKLELIEIACAVVPVNAGSLVTGAKSMTGKLPKGKTFSSTKGAKTMKTVMSGDQKKAIDGALSAHEAHIKSMDGLAGHLEELSEAASAGKEADHASMSTKCHAAFQKSLESHKALGEAIATAHKAITGQEPEGEVEPGEPAEPEEGTEPVSDGEAKSFMDAFEKAMK